MPKTQAELFDFLSNLGIKVSTISGYGDTTVAEHAMGVEEVDAMIDEDWRGVKAAVDAARYRS